MARGSGGAHRPYATGLRNPTALAIQPGTDRLWAVVNERDEIGPDYALGAHVAALGLAFSGAAMGPPLAEGVFVGQHGRWNRREPVGYRVVFVPFRDGRPAGEPIDVVSGFLTDAGHARGRPVGVSVDPRGALIVADDLSNMVWRVTPSR